MPLFLSAFEIAHSSRFDAPTLDDTKLSNQAAIVRKILINALSDITDNPAFAQTHPISSPIFRQLGDWLNAANPALQSAACLALGNLARDDDSALSLVSSYTVHMPVAKLLADPSNTNTLLIHSALGFLKNLAIPPQNKRVLGPSLFAPSVLPRIWAMETLPQVHLAAASLARMLLVNAPENVEILCSPLSTAHKEPTTDPSPASADPSAADAVAVAAAAPTPALTNLHNLLALFRRTDDPAKMEAARAVLRVVRSPLAASSRSLYDAHLDIPDAVSHLLVQTRWPPLRSETITALAQASRTEAALPMLRRLFSKDDAFAVLRDAIKGTLPEAAADSNDSEALAAEVMQAGAEQAAADAGVAQPPPAAKAANGSKRADQENSLIIAWNLIQGAKSEVLNEAAVEVAETQPLRQISEFEDLVNKAGSLLSSEAKENNVEAS